MGAAAGAVAAAGGPVLGEATSTAPGGRQRRFGLGLVTYNLAPDWDLDTIIKRCKAAGVAAVEFRTTHAHGVEPTLTRVQRADVKKRCADAGLIIWGLGSTCEFHSPDPAVVAQNIVSCTRFIELARDIGAAGVKVRPNGLPDGVSPQKTIEQIGKSLRSCGQAAADAGVEIWCEVHGSKTAAPAIMRKIMDIADHPKVGVTWNSNAADVVKGSVRESFELLAAKIYSCHINELVGGYPYRELFTLLNARGYDRYTLMELQGLRTREGDDLVRFMRYYRALWDEMSSPEKIR